MKKHKLKKGLFFMIPPLFVILGTVTCFSGDHDKGVLARIKQSPGTHGQAKGINLPIPVPVNTVKARMDYQGGQFFTETRKDKVQRFRCSSCHNNKDVMIKNAARISHADVKVIHGGKDKPLSCYTCHSKKDRDFLNSSKNNKIDMDHVYEMCGECHFRQKKDWIGGAHGKRVTYWAGERVIRNCTSCHDPHAPRFEKRWPATYSVPIK